MDLTDVEIGLSAGTVLLRSTTVEIFPGADGMISTVRHDGDYRKLVEEVLWTVKCFHGVSVEWTNGSETSCQ